MDTPLKAAASTAGSIISASEFEVPPFQRDYSWRIDEVREFFSDLRRSLDDESYFLGLIILTEEEGSRKKIVDGQQRIVTLTLLAAALFHEAKTWKRGALADRLSADFLYSINYDTDANIPRVILTDAEDNRTLQYIIENGRIPVEGVSANVSGELCRSFEFLRRELQQDLRPDPFRRLGKWSEFITHKLYFAVFVHPDPASAYQVFEVINTRGRDLTTADLLKNFIISQSAPADRISTLERWKSVADSFESDGANFVQYIRHIVTVQCGHILPKDLFSFLAARSAHASRRPPTSAELLDLLELRLPLYLQMTDPSLPGPAGARSLNIFGAFNRLGIITVRPLMMAMFDVPDPERGLESLLCLVIRRIVVGNLGTGNIERRFAEAARRVHQFKSWQHHLDELSDLSPDKETFCEALQRRTFNKNVLTYLKNAISAKNVAPEIYYPVHFIVPKSVGNHPDLLDSELSYWGSTIGNAFLSTQDKRIGGAEWRDFQSLMLPTAAPGEAVGLLRSLEKWDVEAIRRMGQNVALAATDVWY